MLGPVLFLLYVNHAVSGLKSHFKIFADDIKLYLCSIESEDFTTSFQMDIDRLVSTSASWGLDMNPSKCVVIRFSRGVNQPGLSEYSPYFVNGQQLRFVNSHSDLGVTVDNSLKFHSHINKITGSTVALTNNILGSVLCREAEFLMNIYRSHVRPQMEYASSLWNTGYVGDVRRLERVQKRWTRSVAGLEELPYGERLRRLNLFSFQGRLLRSDLILLWKIVHNRCAINPNIFSFAGSAARVTRGHRYKILHPRFFTDTYKEEIFTVRVINRWNRLSEDTVSADSLEKFKSLLFRDIGQDFFNFLYS